MASLILRVVVHETSKPLPGIIVTWYASRDRRISRKKRETSKWDRALEGDADAGLKRLGSALTDASGRARLEMKQGLASQGSPELFAWYSLRTAEIAGQSCSRTMHVGCDSIPLTDVDEDVLVRLPRALLDSAGVDRRGSDTVDGVRDLPKIRDALRRAETIPSKRTQPAAPFSAKLNARIAAARAASAAVDADQMRGGSYAPGLRRRGSGGTEPALKYDNVKRRLTVTDPQKNKDVRVTYKGIVRYKNPRLTEKGMESPYLKITESSGDAMIALPSVPDELVSRATEPSRLVRFAKERSQQIDVHSDRPLQEPSTDGERAGEPSPEDHPVGPVTP